MRHAERVSTTPGRPDDVERAHLIDPADTSFRIDRFPPAPELVPVIGRFWVPTWSLPPGEERVQRVLQHPAALIVVSPDYDRCYGIAPGLSETRLSGTSWAFGVMLRPCAGHLVTGLPMGRLRGRHLPLVDAWRHGGEVADAVRRIMRSGPGEPEPQRAAAALVSERLAEVLPVGEEAELVDAVVDAAVGKPGLVRVADLAALVGIGERALQRLTATWLGLSPKWLLQRRRLHDASERLRTPAELATIAADLGYVDQAHFTRDWRRVTGMTPKQFASRFATTTTVAADLPHDPLLSRPEPF